MSFYTLTLCILYLYTLVAQPLDATPPLDITYIDRAVTSYMDHKNISGMAVAIFDGKSDHLLSYGLANKKNAIRVTENTLFEIASITKVFTATAIALHVLKGDMDLNDPISRFLPSIDKSRGDINKVTLLNLATHTSSLPTYLYLPNQQLPDRQQMLQILQQWQPKRPIGTHYLYSNLSFGLLGYSLETVEHRSFEEVLRQDILLPLQMTHSFVEVPPTLMPLYAQGYTPNGQEAKKMRDHHLGAGGALRSTSKDMLQFLKANLGLIGPENLRKAMELTHRPFYKVNQNLTMGLGWQRVEIAGMLTIEKNGGRPGFSSYIGFIPERKIGIVVLMNRRKAEATSIGRHLLESMISRDLVVYKNPEGS